jgi:cytochrome c5
MKLRPVSVLLSLILVGAAANAALSDDKAAAPAKHKMDMKADLNLVKQAEQEAQEVEDMCTSMCGVCDHCGTSNDPKVLKGAVSEMSTKLKKAKDEEAKLLKQLKSLELDFHSPIGAY